MKLQTWLKERQITLRPWQVAFAQAVLLMLHPFRMQPAGKTFIWNVLTEFLMSHGNSFEL